MITDEHRTYLDGCCEALGVQLHEVLGKTRSVQHIVHARQAATWAVHDRYPDLSWSKLGKLLKRDHTTLMYSAGQFAKARHAGAEWAIEFGALLAGKVAPLSGLESPFDTLRSCPGIDLSDAVDMPLELGAVG